MRYLKSPSHSHKLIWMLLSSFMVMAGGMHPTLWGFFGEANILLLFILRVIFSESCVELFRTPQVMLVHILDFMWLLSNVLHCATITFVLISLNSCLLFCGVDAWTAELLMETRPWHLRFRLLFTWGVTPLSPQQSSSGIQALGSPCTAGPKRPSQGPDSWQAVCTLLCESSQAGRHWKKWMEEGSHSEGLGLLEKYVIEKFLSISVVNAVSPGFVGTQEEDVTCSNLNFAP